MEPHSGSTYSQVNSIPDELRIEDTSAVERQFLAELAGLAPELQDAGGTLFRRIVTPNWALEWGMPRWLGETFDLSEHITGELVMANAYMLAYIRITDDLADGDAPGSSVRLAVSIYHLWMRRYLRLFDEQRVQATREFWAYFDECMTRWLNATMGAAQPVPPFGSYTEADYLHLADRGATLKIVCAAACLLAGRERDLPLLGSATDDIMAGVVLLDDRFDWRTDLDAGRYNAFVAYCSDLPQIEEYRDANRRAVLEEIHFGKAAQPYFTVIAELAERARRNAEAAGCRLLARFAEWYAEEAVGCGVWLRNEAASRMHDFLVQHSVPVEPAS